MVGAVCHQTMKFQDLLYSTEVSGGGHTYEQVPSEITPSLQDTGLAQFLQKESQMKWLAKE